MTTEHIQEQFDNYIRLLEKAHEIDNDIDASITETEISELEEKRLRYKNRMKAIRKNLISLIEESGEKYTVYNTLTKKQTSLYVEEGNLKYHED
ncbi:hypothetical protein [Pedobacter sp. Leaf194]|uniref:hypothetical protein n=1 Tax=Pedobacter sp. Leaf194 TaxID=1736297 RepID=UPI000702772F|nr:hypothetical protein [Pedobacter sp. Leaf194]KQS35661.1 hypothetical protein ASG14_09290 [Pedobacter sp. Leaf194]RYD79741.1 MAG: hypothetical protein EOP55_04045 [Sphingobacteriales bacterium]